MNYTPVVLSYFSQNSGQEYLQFLDDEYKSIARSWEQYKVHKDSSKYFDVDFPARGSADSNEVADDIRNFHQDVIIFHFSGHAGNQQLIFRDGASKANGLAGLLGEAQNLKLVFLNGCATQDQVKLLFDNNVKIVIATKGKVSDGIAREFSETFYEALSDTSYTIRSAFKHTLDAFIANPDPRYAGFNDLSAEPIVWRGSLVTQADEDRDRWELYVKDKHQPELDRREWWALDFIRPTPKDWLARGDFWDKALLTAILITLLIGLSVIIYSAFIIQNVGFGFLGLAIICVAIWGYKSAKGAKTLGVNLDLTDSSMIRQMKTLSQP